MSNVHRQFTFALVNLFLLCPKRITHVCKFLFGTRVAEVGSLTARAKMAIKIFVWRAFAIPVTDASFWCIIANSIQYKMQYLPCISALFLTKNTIFDKKNTIFDKKKTILTKKNYF